MAGQLSSVEGDILPMIGWPGQIVSVAGRGYEAGSCLSGLRLVQCEWSGADHDVVPMNEICVMDPKEDHKTRLRLMATHKQN